MNIDLPVCDSLLENFRQAKQLAESLLVELMRNRLAYVAIARKYLDGKLRRQLQLLEWFTSHVEQMIEHLN